MSTTEQTRQFMSAQPLIVAQHPKTHIPVVGPVVILMPLGLTDVPPCLVSPTPYGRRYIELRAVSPSLDDLERTARWVNSKYHRGTTHTFFETVDIYTRVGPSGSEEVLHLGMGS